MKILICDDDPDIRTAMRRTLRGYEVAEAGNPSEGLDWLKTNAVDAIVSDFSMDADSDGLDFLQVCKVMYPETIRFLVTANRDLEIAVRACNEGAVHRYFLKPWNDDKLRSALEILLRSKNRA